jgi:DNA-binding IclR family transcriptional regulator
MVTGARIVDGAASLHKGIAVIKTVASSERDLRFSDLVVETDLPKATLHRIVAALMEERLLRYDQERRSYALGFGLFELARRVWDELEVRKVAERKLRELRDEVGETVHLAILDGEEVVYIDKYETRESVRTRSAIGTRAPAFCTGVGKAILAFLPEKQREDIVGQLHFVRFTDYTITSAEQMYKDLAVVRARGYATDAEEHHLDICCIAAPIFDVRNRVVASVSITAPTFRLNAHYPLPVARSVVNVAQAISRMLGNAVRPDEAAPRQPRLIKGKANQTRKDNAKGRHPRVAGKKS